MHNNTYLQPYSELAKVTQVGDRAVLPFQTGKTYRLRLINMSALAAFYFSIDGHTMRVIEVDGVETQELEAGALPISTAQRYSVLVTARNDTANNWAIHANMDPDMFDAIPDDLQLNITAQVVYDEKAPLSEPVIYDQYPEFEELNLVPVEVEGMAPADVVYDLNVNFDTYNDGTNRASFNNITFQFSKVPSLFSMLSMGQDANNPVIYGAQTNALMATHNQMVQINIYNWDAGKHPFHLHGHKFAVVQKNYDATVGQPINETQVNPVRRDTIMVPPTGSISMRFRADNPGAWLIHCHIEWHLESGLAAIVFEAPNEAQQRIKVPQFMIDQCASQQIPTSGNAVGKNSTTDLKGEPWGPFPQTLGWTARAKGALAGTVLAALAGMASVVWYSSHQYSQEEVEEIHRRRQAARAERGSRFQQLRSMFQ
jgi:iron transport multicopper oxidase